MSAPLRAGLPQPIPERIERLPRHRGYPVPWFVAWLDDGAGEGVELNAGEGTPDFRVIGSGKLLRAHDSHLCWICGQRLGRHVAFTLGPMCAINRVSSEPPSHRDCSDWAARACPFLARPHMARRGDPEAERGAQALAGNPLLRNPGVALVWITTGYQLRVVAGEPGQGGGYLFDVRSPTEVRWYREGRPATRAEVQTSIDNGLPALEKEATERAGATGLAHLAKAVAAAEKYLPQG